jgi:FtsZ-binding cell division protein ZapB
LDRGFLSRTREEHAAEVLSHRITVLKEDKEELKSERDDLAKANVGAQKLVAKLKGEKASWQEKYLNLLEGNKAQR